ncbi:NUDIX domain-containing protein [Phototrophicus methaneseepsis]|uniref:NUDIX domain-containing protein n=1 Tax=Phototrophicus methaneseepsis TaxID=2710758 RepID=A0A7S8ICX6_9CHLR|nr:NUDIX domain-containing protein [Phototrophicus methaneseepsis]QPC80774.1 NUDIX domain-containing protein [Phototrophicus methaneseepsis]
MTRRVDQPRAKFCPNCGKPTQSVFTGGRHRDTCPECGFIQYATYSFGVGALVLRDETVLLVERGIPPIGVWTIPGGFLEQEDDVYTAVQREVYEEASLNVTPQGIVIVRNRVDANRNDMYIVMLCEALPDQQPVPDGRESTQACFVHPHDFDDMNISVFTRWVVEHYLAHRPSPMQMMTVPGYRSDAIIFGNI